MATHPGVIAGPVRRPRNLFAHAPGSIHEDATAQGLGFRAGTVAGSVHMDQFPPLLLTAFGNAWFETGSLSLYFKHATADGEEVQAFVARPERTADAQVRAWLTTPDETLAAEGTAAVGSPADASAVRARDLRPVDPARLRILAAVQPGDSLGELMVPVNADRQRTLVEQAYLTEPLPWYSGSSPWGGPIASPSTVVDLLYRELLAPLKESIGTHVGLFGAIEIRFEHGPVFVDRTYRVSGEVVAVSETPRTEVLWYDSHATDDAGERVATMRMMLREMKASSPLYADVPDQATRS